MLIPVQQIAFLGFISDSVKQAFILLKEKKLKFAMFRDTILSSSLIAVKTLQRFVGKAISFSLAVPAVKLFTREVNPHIGKALKTSRAVRMTETLRRELEHWMFLDDWDGFLPWKDERHLVVKIISDASDSDWILSLPDGQHQTKDYWRKEDISLPGIAIREVKALYKILSAFSKEVSNGRVIAHIDNTNLLDFWNHGGGRSLPLTDEIKDLFFLTSKLNILFKLAYVPSESNDADAPSRFSSDLDCCLSDSSWELLDKVFGSHTFDLMAIPSNVRRVEMA